MIFSNNDCKVEYRENMRGGDGTVEIRNLVNADALLGKGRLFAEITLPVGASIGYHVHEADSEIFRVLEGEGEYDDNGTVKAVKAGDVLVCGVGEGHSIKNTGAAPFKMTALIIYA